MTSINYEIQNMLYQNLKRKKKFNKSKINFIDDLEQLEVNTVKDITNFKDFKSLTIPERLEIIQNYFNKINISEKDQSFIINLIKKDNLKNKTDIDYDKVNKSIRNIKILKFNNDTNYFFINILEINNYDNQILKSKRNINKLIS